MRRMLDVDIPGKRRRGRPNLRWRDACKRDMTEAGLKEDNTTNRAEWRKKLISYNGDPRRRDKPGMKQKKNARWFLCVRNPLGPIAVSKEST